MHAYTHTHTGGSLTCTRSMFQMVLVVWRPRICVTRCERTPQTLPCTLLKQPPTLPCPLLIAPRATTPLEHPPEPPLPPAARARQIATKLSQMSSCQACDDPCDDFPVAAGVAGECPQRLDLRGGVPSASRPIRKRFTTPPPPSPFLEPLSLSWP
jgi:hypothetical protein